MKKLLVLLFFLLLISTVWESLSRILPSINNQFNKISEEKNNTSQETINIVLEESVVTKVVKDVGPSVVTIGAENSINTEKDMQIGPFSVFFDQPLEEPLNDTIKEEYIGSGFIIKSNGLIVTNKHVISDKTLKYLVIDHKGDKYKVEKIYQDPLNDIAILKVKNPPSSGFKTIELGNSSNLQVGQYAIAIGTALGEFRNTVTTGVISGLGRGVTAGNAFQGYVERLDNVIQTDAAINPGNSGGPLLNSKGQAIGINTAVARDGQNIGFAIPINIVKDSLKNFEETGEFNRPFLGVHYDMINKRAALLNDVPEGAYILEVIKKTSAEKAGVKKGDIIIKIDGKKVTESTRGLAGLISGKKIGDTINISLYRDDKIIDIKAVLQQAPEE
ncbi:PDZ domain-containing protein [Candidatus Parcubacteria bacterium]|nr:MAG: PDZ domain-containing protein [Candidatus Parcubacteria bacterium]